VYHSAGLSNVRNQLLDTDAEPAREAKDGAQPRLPGRPLEPRDLGGVEPRSFRELLLGQPGGKPQPSEVAGELLLRGHVRILDQLGQ
jgi:hypothetical protein